MLSRKSLLVTTTVLLAFILGVGSTVVLLGTPNGGGRDLWLDDIPSTATYVVNTDGAGNYWATRYDGKVVWSGTNASQIAQNALDNCNNGTVFFREGTYILDTPLVIDSSSPYVLGSGIGTVLKNKDATDFSASYRTAMINIYRPNVVIDSIAIDGNKGTITVDEQYKNNGIYVNGAAGQNCYGDNVTVKNCFVYDTYLNGISGTQCANVKILNNRILGTGHGPTGYDGHGIYLSNSYNVQIEGNTIEPYYGMAIKFMGIYQSSTIPYQLSTITDNICLGERIYLLGIEHALVDGNLIDKAPYGIELDYSGVNDTCQDIRVSNNIYYGNGSTNQGVVLNGMDITFDGNQLFDVTGVGIGTFGKRIRVINTLFYNCVATDNVFYSYADDGIEVNNNRFIGWKANKFGIYLNQAHNCTVKGNYFERETVSGYAIILNATHTLIYGNKIVNATYGIKENTGSDYNTIILNDAYYCTTGILTVGSNTKVNLCWNSTTWIS